MTFWTNNSAAPNFLMTLAFYNRRPEFLRTTMPKLYPDTYIFSDGTSAKVRRLLKSDLIQVGIFLENSYKGDDWRICDVLTWIEKYLEDTEVVALGLVKKETDLISVIFSVPLGGPLLMSHGGRVNNPRVIEGLCVAPSYRDDGVAGFMLRHIDAFTSYKFGVTAHLWARELDSVPFINTALTVDKYGYKFTGLRGVSKTFSVDIMPWDSFVRLWTTNSSKWVIDSCTPCLVATVPSNRRGKNTVYFGYGGIMVVCNTERISTDGNKRIYEIVWSGKLTSTGLMPADDDFDFKQLADGVASLVGAGGVLFGTSSPCCGGVRQTWEGWNIGRSGYHALYLYNYMPPAFGACRIHILRDEL